MPVQRLTRCPASPAVTLEPRPHAPYVTGPAVVTLQRWLAILGRSVGANGHYGPVTQAAVRTLQQQYAGSVTPRGVILPNGIVGPATWCLLGTLVAARVTPPAPPRALSVAVPTLPEALVGQPFSATLTAQGGTPPYTWLLTRGTLPPGVILTPTGTLAGVPTQAGTYTATVAVRDDRGHVATRTLVVPVTTPSSAGGVGGEIRHLVQQVATALHTTPTVVELGAAAAAAGLLLASIGGSSGGRTASRGGQRR